MAIYAKFTGTKQGVISGSVTARAFDGQIPVQSCDFGVGSPYDVATGQASGRRVARPIHLTKPLDKASPLLFTSATTNEALTVEISYTIEGEGHKKYVTLKLTNAMIRDFSHTAGADGTAVEKLALTYTKFEFTWVEGGIVAVDDWANPV